MPRRQQGRVPTGLGKALVNANHRPRNQLRADKASLHYADLTTLPSSSAQPSHLASVTDRSELDEFLHSAIAAEETFEAEKQQLVVLQSDAFEAKTSKREYNSSAFVSPTPATAASSSAAPTSVAFVPIPSIPIPRRPHWTSSMSAEELSLAERDSFLGWRRQLASLEEEQHVLMTPFEKNIEVWKQLWRVIDRCSVVATIVDARNPLLYRSEDMEQYVAELGRGSKVNVTILNKADYLSVEQRRLWVKWFDRAGLRVVFWSAARSMQQEEEKERRRKERERRRQERQADKDRGLVLGVEKVKLEEVISDDENGADDNEAVSVKPKKTSANREQQDGEDESENDEENGDGEEKEKDDHDTDGHARVDESKDNQDEEKSIKAAGAANIDTSRQSVHNSIDILTRDLLLDYFRHAYHSIQPTSPVPSSSASTSSPSYSRIQIGFVGFPNVGKSSTINALMLTKRVTVGATPGKTKHFQTLNCEADFTLCDCPGLVFPSFLASRAELVCNGVMPIDQMREYANYTAPVALMVRRVGAEQLRQQYSLVFPHWRQEEEEDDREGETSVEVEAEYRRRAEEVLNAHARMRGWMKDHGRPDESRSARVLLKDLFTGKLLYCYRPPGLSVEEVTQWKQAERKGRTASRIVGEWKGEDVEQDGPGDADGSAAVDDEDDGVLASRMVRTERGKVNKHVMMQMLQDEYDDELALQDEDGMAGGSRAGQPTKKQLLRERQRTKRRTGKAVKLKKTAVTQDAVQMRIGGLSEGAAVRMGIVQSSRDGGPQKLKGSLTQDW